MSGAATDLPPPVWQEPGDETLHWKRDLAHFPGQLSELDGELLQSFIEHGFSAAMASHSLPFTYLIRRMWTYHYVHEGQLPVPEEDRAAVQERGARARERARVTIAKRWEQEWLPEVHEHLAYWAGIDPKELQLEALIAHLGSTLERSERLWVVHFEIIVAIITAKRDFVELYEELFEPASALEAQTLLSGFDVLTTRAARALWPLRELVSAGAVRDTLLGVAPRDAWQALLDEPAASELVEALEAYLNDYGRRTPYLLFSAPSLREYPAPVMSMLRHMVERPDADPARLLALQRKKREAAEGETQARLRFYPAPVREEFEARLAAAQTAAVLGEDHNYLIDYSATTRVREVFLACGAVLAERGLLERADDVVHLRVAEVRAALRDALTQADAPSGGADLRERVAARKEELERFAHLEPPHDVNPPAAEEDADDVASEPEPAPADPDSFQGTAASFGVARGRARVLRSLDSMGELLPGEVLVASTTAQGWTPLFATAAALVTETGSLVTHAAVVAREYGLPAVVALPRATHMIPDGALVEVDGGTGTVRVLSRHR